MFRYCHLYNRGVDRRIIFNNDQDRDRFVQSFRLARLSKSPWLSSLRKNIKQAKILPEKQKNFENEYGPSTLDVVAYCLMPNHFHFLVKEVEDGGISQFFRKLGTSYAMYFNLKNERTGSLFESRYKLVQVTSDEQLIHLSRYIHLNPVRSSSLKISLKNLKQYSWSSLPDYLGIRKQPFCDPKEVMNFFSKPKDYFSFLSREIGDEVLDSNLLFD